MNVDELPTPRQTIKHEADGKCIRKHRKTPVATKRTRLIVTLFCPSIIYFLPQTILLGVIIHAKKIKANYISRIKLFTK